MTLAGFSIAMWTEISGDNDSGVKGHLGKVSRKESDVTRRGEC